MMTKNPIPSLKKIRSQIAFDVLNHMSERGENGLRAIFLVPSVGSPVNWVSPDWYVTNGNKDSVFDGNGRQLSADERSSVHLKDSLILVTSVDGYIKMNRRCAAKNWTETNLILIARDDQIFGKYRRNLFHLKADYR